MLYITRKEHFSASHTLKNPKLSWKKNEEIFGKCSNFHGHNYYLEVTLCGEADSVSGYVFDLKKLSKIITKEILDKVDHKFLNDVNIFNDINPTTENMAKIFWTVLKPKLKTKNSQLYSIKLYETDKNMVEYKD